MMEEDLVGEKYEETDVDYEIRSFKEGAERDLQAKVNRLIEEIWEKEAKIIQIEEKESAEKKKRASKKKDPLE